MRGIAHRIAHSRKFEYILVVLIAGSALLLGVTTFDRLVPFVLWMAALFWFLTLVALLLDVLLRMFALWPRVDRYFRVGWNLFDFLAISFMLLTLLVWPALTINVMLVLLVRLLRLLRGLSTVRELRVILVALIRSIPSMGHVVVLLGIILYAYGIVGYHNFGEHDPTHWGNLGVSILSLFQIMTMDDWGNIMIAVSGAEPMAWVYFISFVIISAYIVANLFVAVVVRNLAEVIQERWRPRPLETPASTEESLRELRSARQTLDRLEERLRQGAGGRE